MEIYYPESVKELQTIIKRAYKSCLKVVVSEEEELPEPQEDKKIIIKLDKLNRVLKIYKESGLVTVESGIKLKQFSLAVQGHGCVTPPLLGLSSYTLNRWLSNLIPYWIPQYGRIEDSIVGIKGITLDGEIIEVPPAPRRAVGLDLRYLFIGTRNILGIPVEVTFKTIIKPLVTYLFEIELSNISLEELFTLIKEVWNHEFDPLIFIIHYNTSVKNCSIFLVISGNTRVTELKKELIQEYLRVVKLNYEMKLIQFPDFLEKTTQIETQNWLSGEFSFIERWLKENWNSFSEPFTILNPFPIQTTIFLPTIKKVDYINNNYEFFARLKTLYQLERIRQS